MPKMSAHEKFVEKLRKPVRDYEAKLERKRHSRQIPEDMVADDEDIQRELELKFDELFGKIDDDD